MKAGACAMVLRTALPLLLFSLLALGGCASLLAERDPPKVMVENVRALPNSGGGPRFEIVLRIANPNKTPLDIAGISYSVDVLEHEVVNGVSKDVPRIDAYSEQTVRLEAGVNLFQLLRLLAQMGQSTSEALDYRFSAKIDFVGFVPTQRIEETGSLALNQ